MPPLMVKLKAFRDMYSEDEIRGILGESGTDLTDDVDFEAFLKVSTSLWLVCFSMLLDNIFHVGNLYCGMLLLN